MLTPEQLTRLKEVCKTASNNASSLYEVNEAESALADIDAEIQLLKGMK